MTDMTNEIPTDHPSLERYPASPTVVVRTDAGHFRVPVVRADDEAVPVEARDVAAATHLLAGLAKLARSGQVDLTLLAPAACAGWKERRDEPTWPDRDEVTDRVEQVAERLRSCLPEW